MLVKKFPIRFFLFSFTLIFCMLFLSFNAAADIEDHITRTESGFYYSIQKGDTLWDLSQQFSNSPWVWPEMWHYNPQIKNPHLIYPGQKILIYKKEWEGKDKQQEPALEEPVQKVTTYHIFDKIDRVGFIRDKAVTPHGTIFKAQDNINLIAEDELVYIYPEPGSPQLSVGVKYSVFRTFDPVRDIDTGKNYGVQHLLTGVLEITAVEPEFAIGKVISSYKAILANDYIMPYEKRSVNIPIRESKAGLSGKVIKQEAPNNLVGQYDIIFIDKGEIDGIEPGQFYSIYLEQTARLKPDNLRQIELTPYEIGELIVLHTEKTTSTVLITKSSQPINPGNLVRTLEVAAP